MKELDDGLINHEKLLEDIIIDAQGEVEEFYAHHPASDMPRPYAAILDDRNVDLSVKVKFPVNVQELDRVSQYHVLARFISSMSISAVSICAVLRIDVPQTVEIDEKFWNRNCPALLLGVAVPEADSIVWKAAIVLFDHFGDRLEFFKVENMKVWEEFVDHTDVFRDFLFYACTHNNVYELASYYQALTRLGFEFQFLDEQHKKNFFAYQPSLMVPEGANVSML